MDLWRLSCLASESAGEALLADAVGLVELAELVARHVLAVEPLNVFGPGLQRHASVRFERLFAADLLHLSDGQSKALLLLVAEVFQEFFATATISVALLRILAHR